MEVAVAAGVAMESARSGFDIGMPIYAAQVLEEPMSTDFYSSLHTGQACSMLLISLGMISVDSVSLAPISFIIIAFSYGVLALFLPSYFLFMVMIYVMGLGIAMASVSSTVILQVYGDGNRAARSHIHAAYRIAGILTRIFLPVIVGMKLNTQVVEEREEGGNMGRHPHHTKLLGLLASFLATFALAVRLHAYCLLSRASSDGTSEQMTHHESEGIKESSLCASILNRSRSSADSVSWVKIWKYCAVVSLPNAAGGIVRSVFGVQLLAKTFPHTASATFFTNTHAIAQCAAVLTVMLLSKLMASGKYSWWRVLFVQAAIMVVSSYAMAFSSYAAVINSILFTLFRAAEESAKLSNSMLLSRLCEQPISAPNKSDPKVVRQPTRVKLLAKAVALQKIIGSVYKIASSILSSFVLKAFGVQTTLLMGATICAIGTALIAIISPGSKYKVKSE